MRRPVGTLFVTVAVLLLFQTLNLAPYQAWIVFFFNLYSHLLEDHQERSP